MSQPDGTEVFGHRYKFGKLSAMEQFHVMRRLYAVSSALGEGFDELQKRGGAAALENAKPGEKTAILEIIAPLLRAVGKMEDKDVEYVVNTCMRVVVRANPGGTGWSQVMPQPGVIMFQDVDMPQMLALTWHVLQNNLSGFFFDLLSGFAPVGKMPGSSS